MDILLRPSCAPPSDIIQRQLAWLKLTHIIHITKVVVSMHSEISAGPPILPLHCIGSDKTQKAQSERKSKDDESMNSVYTRNGKPGSLLIGIVSS